MRTSKQRVPKLSTKFFTEIASSEEQNFSKVAARTVAAKRQEFQASDALSRSSDNAITPYRRIFNFKLFSKKRLYGSRSMTRPSNGDLKGLQKFEADIANIIGAGIRDAGSVR